MYRPVTLMNRKFENSPRIKQLKRQQKQLLKEVSTIAQQDIKQVVRFHKKCMDNVLDHSKISEHEPDPDDFK